MGVRYVSKLFYAKLAGTNLKKNKEVYYPYIIACVGAIFTYYMLLALAKNKGMDNIPEGHNLDIMFTYLGRILAVFSAIFIVYANSFLMKRRKKEIGLYGILGMEKSHVAWVMFFENLYIAVISLGISILLGIMFGKLFFMILLKVINVTKTSEFMVAPEAIFMTVEFFAVVFIITFIWNFIQVKTSKPIALLNSSKEGEKEPKASILVTIIGLVLLGIGYYIALTTNSLIASISSFFLAALLVIGATYALFMSGSIFLLKLLKKNKKIYYSPRYFVSISNMIYRMKKNAAGLANICILSTAVLIVVSTTLSIYAGKEEAIRKQCIYDMCINVNSGLTNQEDLVNNIDPIVKEANLLSKDNVQYNYIEVSGVIKNGVICPLVELKDLIDYKAGAVTILTEDDYNSITGENVSLKSDEAILFNQMANKKVNSINLNGNAFSIVKNLDSFDEVAMRVDVETLFGYVLVVDNIDTIRNIYDSLNVGDDRVFEDDYRTRYSFNLNGTAEEDIDLYNSIYAYLSDELGYKFYDEFQISCLEETRQGWNIAYGGLLFLGIFVGFLFIIAMILIIYFKQVSEGYEDKDRFNILQKVGMDKDEVKATINKQIKLVFIMPVAGAIIHLAFAYHLLSLILENFNVVNKKLVVLCMALVSIAFVVLYVIVYAVTSLTYKRIVNR